eukprot:TRINITY_DN49638_c0_g1_i1.p1 TRINITY_DN49638_c0_g1~~TRINITY_DN49638_c0_g1_i1.p1  ORF type:complete len:918 (+),score=148.81 TRINITY_DN49638_c0_g1_i1:121-2874(+)
MLQQQLLDGFRHADFEGSGRLTLAATQALLNPIGLAADQVVKLVEASRCGSRADPSNDESVEVDYVSFCSWLVGEASSQEVLDAGFDEKPPPSCAEPRSAPRSWIDRCARVLETRGEADYIQKKLIATQIHAHLRQLEEKQSVVPTRSRRSSIRPQRNASGPGHGLEMTKVELQWDGAALMEKFLKEDPASVPVDYAIRVLDSVFEVLPQIHPSPLVRVRIPDGGRVVVVGDTHGQLQDVLLIMLLHGLPARNNVYLVNGDVADRGPNACLIFLLLFAFFLGDPGSVILHRGNHEDQEMNYMSADEGGGFFDECATRYGEAVYWKFIDVFTLLPLASVVGGEVFVVHGGLPPGPPPLLSNIEAIEHTKVCCPAPSAESVQDRVFVGLMWSDPQENPGQAPNPRGAGILWGPDTTKSFLAKNNLRWIIRSHELPYSDRGWMEHHLGLVFTVFSASNYTGCEVNWGAVAVLTCNAEGHVEQVLREHNVPDLASLAKVASAPEGAEREEACRELGLAWVDNDRVAVGERRVQLALRRLAGIVVESKPDIWRQCQVNDRENLGVISKEAWLDCIVAVCGDDLPWEVAMEHWLDDPSAHVVHYRNVLGRFSVGVSHERWCSWKSVVIGDVYRELLTRNYEALELINIFDPSGDGIVTLDEFRQLLSQCTGGCLSVPQLEALCRTVFAQTTGTGLKVEEFLSRFTVAFVQSEALLVREGSFILKEWEGVVGQIGKLIIRSAPRQKGMPTSLVQCFRSMDDSNDGFLQIEEFVRHIKMLPGFENIRHYGQPLDEASLQTVAEVIAGSFSQDGLINLLEFSQAFAVVDADGDSNLEEHLHEHILTWLYRLRHALMSGCSDHDEESTGRVGKEHFKSVLESVNVVAARPETHLTQMQIDLLCESLAEDDGTVMYESFLASFVVIFR